MKLSFDGQSACSLIFRICTNYPSCWSDICRQKFIVQESMFTSPNGKLLGSNKRRKRTIKADNLHALFVHIWILVCYQLPFGPHLQWRLENSFRNILEHSSYISPSTAYAFSTYRRLIMRSEVIKGWTSHSPNLFYDDRYLEENLLISKNKEAFLRHSVCMFACTIFCVLAQFSV